VRREASRHLRKKERECLKDKSSNLVAYSENDNIRGINEFMRDYKFKA
jgi:hypothetical protein